MPSFLSHDIYHNIDGIRKTSDISLKQDFIFSEVAWLIANQKKLLIAKLREAGYNIPKNINDSSIINLIVENSGDDPKLAYALAELINKRNEQLNQDISNSTGGSIVGSIADLIGGIFQNSAAKKLSQGQIEAQKYALAQQVIAMRGQPASDPNVKFVWIFTGVIGVSLIALIAVYLIKKNKSTKTT